MQEALRIFVPLDADAVDSPDCRRTARGVAARCGRAAARAFADDPRPAQIVRRQRGAARHRPAHPGRPVRRHRRPERLRQEHAAAPDRGAGTADSAAAIGFGDGSAGAEDIRVMFQEPRLLPWARVLSTMSRSASARERASPMREAAPRALARGRPGRPARANGRRSCPAARSSAWRWRARWSAIRASWRSTSRSARSMR